MHTLHLICSRCGILQLHKDKLHFKDIALASTGIPFISAPARLPRPVVAKLYIPRTGIEVAILNFLNLRNPSSPTVALGFTQHVTEMSTRRSSCG
jgi:hypothetical protein